VDPEDERDANKAVKNALSLKTLAKVVRDLCGCGCATVKITVEVNGNGKLEPLEKAIEGVTAIDGSGPMKVGQKYTHTFKCPNQ
jgi:hypothetical protein